MTFQVCDDRRLARLFVVGLFVQSTLVALSTVCVMTLLDYFLDSYSDPRSFIGDLWFIVTLILIFVGILSKQMYSRLSRCWVEVLDKSIKIFGKARTEQFQNDKFSRVVVSTFVFRFKGRQRSVSLAILLKTKCWLRWEPSIALKVGSAADVLAVARAVAEEMEIPVVQIKGLFSLRVAY